MTEKYEESAYFHIGNSGVSQSIKSTTSRSGHKNYTMEASLNSHGVPGPVASIPLIHEEHVRLIIRQLEQVLENGDLNSSWDRGYAGGIGIYARKGVEVDYLIKDASNLDLAVIREDNEDCSSAE